MGSLVPAAGVSGGQSATPHTDSVVRVINI